MAIPLLKNHFNVNWGGTSIGFQEVSGLEVEVEEVQYREGSFLTYNKIKIPGNYKVTDVTLKKGTFASDNEQFEWMKKSMQGNPEKRTITITLLNHEHQPIITWTLNNAWPKKITATDLKAEATEVAIDTLVIAYESLTIDNP